MTSLPLRLVQHSLILVPVRINQAGPFEFVVDTGAQVSTVDSSLAAALGLKAEGTTGSGGVGTFSRSEYAHLALVQAGSSTVANSLAVLRDLSDLRAVDPGIRGILGDSFLEHFDVLIDNRHRILCLDDGKAMAAVFKGEWIALAEPFGLIADLPFTRPLLISVQVAGSSETPMLLRLDSGSNAPVLHSPAKRFLRAVAESTSSLVRVVAGTKQEFRILPAIDLLIGKRSVAHVSFAVPMNVVGKGPPAREDGILPTIAFQRVLISAAGHYAAIESW